MRTRPIARACLGLSVVGALLTATAGPAAAACHVAAFFTPELQTSEAAGALDVTVYLQGRQPSCAGTVDFATVDQSGVAGEDFEAVSGTLTFESGDDREETISIAILADDVAEGAEDFQIQLTNPTGGITGTGDVATVTIAADEGAGGADAGGSAGADDAGVVDDASDSLSGGDAATDGGAGSSGLIPVLIGLTVVAVAAALLIGRRRSP